MGASAEGRPVRELSGRVAPLRALLPVSSASRRAVPTESAEQEGAVNWDNYDNWKTRAPDPGTGNGHGRRTIDRAFWQGYEHARRHHDVPSFLAIYRAMPSFAPLVRQVERLKCRGCFGAY